MDKFVSSVVMLIFLWFLPIFSLQHDDGWIPLTEKDVLRKFDRDFTKTFEGHYLSNPVYENTDDIEELKKDVIKMVLPQKRLMILPNPIKIEPMNKHRNDQKEYINKDCEYEETVTSNHHAIYDIDHLQETVDLHKRKPKTIPVADLVNEIKSEQDKNDLLQDFEDASSLHNAIKTNSYQVTENLSDVANDEEIGNRSGYSYSNPTLASNSSKLTNILVDTLTKYNIKLDDDLPNYTLSRQTKRPMPNFMLIPFPLHIPPRFNSFNHLSLDPMLAVFLSNYGYYLPGSYGIQNKYKNLYGYLASNNIHNNKPFGAYKIYSDTDSSN